MKEIYFLRHGETDSNLLDLPAGYNHPLNKTGKEQALYAGKYLSEYRQKYKDFDLVIASPLLRTKETAEIVTKKLNYDSNKIIFMDELKERDGGELIKYKEDEMKKDKKFKDWFKFNDKMIKIEDPIERYQYIDKFSDNIFEKYDAETFGETNKKCKKIINFIKKTPHEKILVVTHNGFIAFMNKNLLDINCFLTVNNKLGDNCHLTYYTYTNNKFCLEYGPTTEYFAIYKKDHSKKS